MDKVDVKTVVTIKQYFKWSFRPTFERKNQLLNGAIAMKNVKVE